MSSPAPLTNEEKLALYPRRAYRPTLTEIGHLEPADIVDIMAADLGIEMEQLASSDAGKILIRRSLYLLVEAWVALETVDAEDPKAVRAVQNQALVSRNILTFMEQTIKDGLTARQSIDMRLPDHEPGY